MEKTKIKSIWKVEGDSNEYQSEQEAQIAEVLAGIEGCYIDTRQRRLIAEAFNGRYFLIPIIPTVTIQEEEEEEKEEEKELEAEDLDPYDQKDRSLPA